MLNSAFLRQNLLLHARGSLLYKTDRPKKSSSTEKNPLSRVALVQWRLVLVEWVKRVTPNPPLIQSTMARASERKRLLSQRFLHAQGTKGRWD